MTISSPNHPLSPPPQQKMGQRGQNIHLFNQLTNVLFIQVVSAFDKRHLHVISHCIQLIQDKQLINNKTSKDWPHKWPFLGPFLYLEIASGHFKNATLNISWDKRAYSNTITTSPGLGYQPGRNWIPVMWLIWRNTSNKSALSLSSYISQPVYFFVDSIQGKAIV